MNAARGGLVHDVSYEDVCVRNSPNPILLDTAYSANGSTAGTLYPEFVDITLRNVRVSGGGKISLTGYSKEHRVGVNLDGVMLTDVASVKDASPGEVAVTGGASYKYSIAHADIKVGPGPVNLKLEGEDTTVTGSAGERVACVLCVRSWCLFLGKTMRYRCLLVRPIHLVSFDKLFLAGGVIDGRQLTAALDFFS